ncbi:MAG TPA: PD-(D/E)XK nuclease family protein, partial [Jiangellaceae bacterium]|nr:PD-(D/E)XK nuclease family protein [Jiangellaceae bacterium]
MNEQPPLAGMPRRLYRATPTRLTTWVDCPRRYRFAYLDRPPPPKGPPRAHNTLGAVVHLALADWWRLPPARRTVGAAGALVERTWRSEGFCDDAQSAEWAGRSRAMVERYVARLDPDVEPRGIERTVATIFGGMALSGRVDRIDERGDELVVVDYKTGRHLLSVDDARSSLALAVYGAATARTLRATCRRVELHHLPTGEVHVWEHDDSTLDRHLSRAD